MRSCRTASSEDVTTPAATWLAAARIHIEGSLKIKSRFNRNVVEILVARTSWLAEGIGEVASEESGPRVFLNGVLQSEAAARTGWLESGMLRGEPIL